MTAHEWTGEPRYRIDRPIMTQQWRSLAYVHWPYAPTDVAQLLPDGLEVDTFDGRAWVGLVPFHMADIAARFTPPIPYFGTFPETNVRTYVRGPEGPGVWFHSLDINRLLPVLVARLTYRLPYVWSKMTINVAPDRIEYRATRRWPGPRGSRSRLVVAVGERIDHPEPFEHFLSARWGLYTMLGSRLAYARVEHAPWPLHRAEATVIDDDLMAAAGYAAPQGAPHVMYSPGVSVRIDRPRIVGAGTPR
jgi:uncharacterized protein YqjF (DUF2071 family)